MSTPKTPESIIADLIEREGGYVNNPADRGGPTAWGITEQVARAFGYYGDMRQLNKYNATVIYNIRYWEQPRYDQIYLLGQHNTPDNGLCAVAVELLDTGVNMGTSTAGKMLQRALNVLNNQGKLWPDLDVDGNLGALTLHALKTYSMQRGAEGARVLLAALNAQQAMRYIELAESKPNQEQFVYGWLRARVMEAV